MRQFNLPAPPTVAKALDNASRKTHYILADSLSALSDLACQRGRQNEKSAWNGNMSLPEACNMAKTGDIKLVEKSDKLLSQFERFSFDAPMKAWQRDVAGHRPDAPAFIAGHPAAMRRRVRLVSQAAPLAVLVDLTMSAGVSNSDIERRGAAILALCRILAGRRPVELWAGCMTDANGRDACAMFARIDTAPLDLARAAFAMVSPAFPRQMLYSLARGAHGFQGHWPFSDHNVGRKYFADIMRPALPHIGEVLAIPAIHMADNIAKNPEQWIAETLAKLESGESNSAHATGQE